MAVITMEGSLSSANPGLVPGVGGREGGNLVEERRQAEWNWGRAREEEGSRTNSTEVERCTDGRVSV